MPALLHCLVFENRGGSKHFRRQHISPMATSLPFKSRQISDVTWLIPCKFKRRQPLNQVKRQKRYHKGWWINASPTPFNRASLFFTPAPHIKYSEMALLIDCPYSPLPHETGPLISQPWFNHHSPTETEYIFSPPPLVPWIMIPFFPSKQTLKKNHCER